MDVPKGLDDLLEQSLSLQNGGSTNSASADIPPGMQRMKDYNADELYQQLNRIPLFMNSLDETDGEGGENIALEAMRALAYEGTRAEIAQNFREQGTELIKTEKRYPEARDFYTKALQALKDPRPDPDPDEIPKVVEIDEEAEVAKERSIEEVCLVNRALCNLEMKNYGSCNRDCAAALRLNPRNVKAWYRAASACLALDKVDESIDACESGLAVEPSNSALKATLDKAQKRRETLAQLEKVRSDREERKRMEQTAVKQAIKARKIPTRTTERPPEMPEAAVTLDSPLDPSSALSFPTMLLYPAHAQTDFITQFWESETLTDHLSYILPLPWDEESEYTMDNVECYMETRDSGLIKAGKKLPLLKLLSSGKLEVVDGLVRINVVPKDKAAQWIGEFKTRRGK